MKEVSGASARRVDVLAVGAGAAGMMAALGAGRRGRRVLLLDHNERPGRKILISGGGRCNFTNIHTRAESFLSGNPHFARSALARYTPAEFIAMVERHGIAYHEKTLGQMFCDGPAQQIVTMLERECGAAGVEMRWGVRVFGVRRGDAVGARFVVETSLGEIRCEALVVATGGLSIPKIGATGWGYELARQFGHSVIEPRAALVPLVFGAEDAERWCDLAGVSAEVVARAEGVVAGRRVAAPEFREKLLVTHRGLSGPAVLQVSSYWRPGAAVTFDLAPGSEVFAALREKNARRDAAAAKAALRSVLPARMAERWVELAAGNGVDARDRADWTNAGLDRMERSVHEWTMRPEGTEGFAKAEVTAGGVDTRELDARTMESGRAEGLYFVGEVVDVTGWLGGYNFQWAWASAVSAGRVV